MSPNNVSATRADLAQPAAAEVASAQSVGAMAQAEGWTPDRYALELSEHIRLTTVPLEAQRERLVALAGIGAKADQAAADELARHYTVLEALAHRFAREAVEVPKGNTSRAADAAEKYAAISIRAQRAAVSCLSALKALRDSPSPDNARTSTIATGYDSAGVADVVGDAAP